MNEQRIAQLRAEQQKLSVDYRTAEAQLHTIGTRLIQIEDEIRAAASADSRAFVLAAVEDRQRAAHAEAERVRAKNAAANEAWRQLQARGETDEARQAREAYRQRQIQIEEDRQAREDENRRRRLAELRERGVVVYE